METLRTVLRTVEFGIYRDGDNNLDASQGVTLKQAVRDSARDSNVEFSVEDTTSRGSGVLHTDQFRIADGTVRDARVEAPRDMASPGNLADFVARVLDDAQASGAKQTWIELTDHGGGDGGGLQADSAHGLMAMPQIADAVAKGIALHARAHPEDAGRTIDGVVANQCLMATLGFADALSHAGVKYLAASPETMVSPGVPSSIADAIARNENDPSAMGTSAVKDVMRQKYGSGPISWGPAAAFDVLDLDPAKMQTIERSVKGVERCDRGSRQQCARNRCDCG